jgi:hypothetical protein
MQERRQPVRGLPPDLPRPEQTPVGVLVCRVVHAESRGLSEATPAGRRRTKTGPGSSWPTSLSVPARPWTTQRGSMPQPGLASRCLTNRAGKKAGGRTAI